jgi:hypothetical protein
MLTSLYSILMSNHNLLVVIHANSLEKEKDKDVVDTLLKCADLEGIQTLATPNRVIDWAASHKISHLTYEDRGHESFVAKYKTLDSEASFLFHDYIPKEMITHQYGFQEGSAEFAEIRSALHDLLAFEAVSRDRGDSIFITGSPYLLEKNVWIQKRFAVKIFSFLQALEYIDLYLRRYDSTFYYVAPHHRIEGGNAFHYWFLLRDLVPKFTEAWSIVVFGTDRIQNGRKIQDVLQGFASKFENALYSSDRIAMEYMKRPNNLTEWEMLYNLNYFCMLLTGIFDLLAWLAVHRYSMPIHRPHEVSIHITGHKSKGAKFVAAIGRSNPSLTSFIVTRQDFIHLFYPMRDATQHREPVSGVQFEQANEGWTVSTASLKKDSVDAIKTIDQNGYPFTRFGLLNTGVLNLMEPNRFTRIALRELIDFSNTYLEMIDFPSLIAAHQDLIDRITRATPMEDHTPFIAEIYWKRNCHMPILYRNR